MFFAIIVCSIITFCLEIDLAAPSFPAMASYFGVDDGMIQYTIAINFIGFCVASLFYGALSDTYGRRPIMVIGSLILMVGGVGCVFAPTIEWMLLFRLIQGIGASAAAVVAFAMIADRYTGEESVRRIALLNAMVTIFMAVAPIVGSFINETWGWRGNLTTIAALSTLSCGLIIFGLPETHHKTGIFSIKQLFTDYRFINKNWTFFNASLVPSLLSAAYMSFVACAAFLYTETYSNSIKEYAIHQGIIVAAFSGVSIFVNRILKRFDQPLSIKIGSMLISIGILGLLTASVIWKTSAIMTTLFMCILAFGDAILYAVIFAESLEIFPNHKGIAMSSIMGLRTLLIAMAAGLMGTVYDHTLWSCVWVISLCMILALISLFFYQRMRGANPSLTEEN